MTYYVYSMDQYGYHNHGSLADMSEAFDYCESLRKNKQARNPWVSSNREGLNHVCRDCGGLVSDWSEPHRCKKCHDASLDRAEAVMCL